MQKPLYEIKRVCERVGCSNIYTPSAYFQKYCGDVCRRKVRARQSWECFNRNREVNLERRRKRYYTDHDRFISYSRNQYIKHKDEIRKAQKEYRNKNILKVRAKDRVRSKIKREARKKDPIALKKYNEYQKEYRIKRGLLKS